MRSHLAGLLQGAARVSFIVVVADGSRVTFRRRPYQTTQGSDAPDRKLSSLILE